MSAGWTSALQAEKRCIYRSQSSVGRHRLSLHRTSPWLPKRRWHVPRTRLHLPRMRRCLPGMKLHPSQEKLCLQRTRLCLLRMTLCLKRIEQHLCNAIRILQKMRLPKELQSGQAPARVNAPGYPVKTQPTSIACTASLGTATWIGTESPSVPTDRQYMDEPGLLVDMQLVSMWSVAPG